MTESTEAEYNELPLAELGLVTVSFDKFGYAEKDDIDELCKKKGLTIDQKIEIRRVWVEHPKRRQQPAQQGKWFHA